MLLPDNFMFAHRGTVIELSGVLSGFAEDPLLESELLRPLSQLNRDNGRNMQIRSALGCRRHRSNQDYQSAAQVAPPAAPPPRAGTPPRRRV